MKGRGAVLTRPHETGGSDRNRTRNILLAKQALSQLSYTPMQVEAVAGFEPATLDL